MQSVKTLLFLHKQKFYMKSIYYKELLLELTKREVKQRYKQSFLGYAWVILNPLTQMLVMAFVFSRIVHTDEITVPYPIFLYVGLLPWILFSSSITTSANSFIENGKLIKKIYLPKTVFIQSTLLAKMIDFLLASVLLILFMFYLKTPVTLSVLWFFPIFLLQTFFTYGLSLLIATLNLFYRDVQYLLNFLLMVWMYLTPIIYPTSFFPQEYQWVFQINPMAVFITSYRQVIFQGTLPDFYHLGISLVVCLLTYLLGLFIFKKLEGRIADAL